MTPLQNVLQKLNGVKETNSGWMAFCPAHEDKDPSLRISWGDDGRVLIKCFAGCDTANVLAAIGLKFKDLFPNNGHKNDDAGGIDWNAKIGGRKKRNKQPKAAPAPTYTYCDADGSVLFGVIRTKDKKFPQCRPDGKGGWWYGLDGIKPVLYRLPEIIKAVEAGETVFIPEGEKDCNNLARLGLAATTSPMGAGNWRNHYSECLEGANVVILPDCDEPGRNHAQDIAKSLHGVAASVKVLELPNLPEKGDVSDWLNSGGTADKLLRLAEETPAWEPGPENKKAKSGTSKVPQITTTNRYLNTLSDDILAALEKKEAAKGDAGRTIFKRGGELAQIVNIEEKDPRGDVILLPVARSINDVEMRGKAARAASFLRITGRDGDEKAFPTSPPLDAVKDVLTRGDWPFPILRGVTQSPILRHDGSIFTVKGYDAHTALYYAPDDENFILPEIPERPNNDDLREAVSDLDNIICDFPFDGTASRANALAAILTPVLRELIFGPVPMAIVNKPTQGTGASLFVEAISIIATGRPAHMEAQPEGRDRENEWRKRITAILIDSRILIAIDNVEGVFRSPTLCLLLTATTWSDRVLGRNEKISLPNRLVLVITGNNVRLAGDLPRRCYEIRMDAKMARPWQRDAQSFKHPNLVEYIKTNRGRLVAAVFTLARAWINAGRPQPKNVPVMGGFEAWRHVIGGILEIAGVTGFLSNLSDLYDKSTDVEGFENFIEAIYEIWGENAFTTRGLRTELLRNEALLNSLPDWLNPEDKNFTRSIGNLFSRRNGQLFVNGLKLEKAGLKKRAVCWKVKNESYNDDDEDIF